MVPYLEQLEARELLAAHPAIGINIERIVDWSPAWTFTDIFKSSREWISHAFNTVTRQQTWEGGGTVRVDEHGWPTQLNQFTNAQGQLIQQRLGTLMFVGQNGRYPGGTYRAEWDGTGSVFFGVDAASATITVQPVDDTAAEGRESVVLTLSAGTDYTLGTATSATATIADNDAAALPVLIVIANQDFCYQEYADTRQSLEAAGLRVEVAAATRTLAGPHVGVCQGTNPIPIMPDLPVADARAANYSTVVFVGGWGSSAYQYAFPGTYSNPAYRGDAVTKAAVNQLVTDFVLQDKYITTICHGVTVLAWARMNGRSVLAGHRVSAYGGSSPPSNVPGSTTTRWHIEQNGATMVPSRSIGDSTTAVDDVLADGKLITAENWDSARQYGRMIADYLKN